MLHCLQWGQHNNATHLDNDTLNNLYLCIICVYRIHIYTYKQLLQQWQRDNSYAIAHNTTTHYDNSLVSAAETMLHDTLNNLY